MVSPLSPVILLRHDNADGKHSLSIPFFDTSELVGKTFLMNTWEDGQHSTVHIVELLKDHEDSVSSSPIHLEFKCSIDNKNYENIVN